jgi:hypothetical protein
VTTATKVPAAERFEWQGETLELDPQVGYTLLAEYRQAAAALATAKAEAKRIEEKIMEIVGGYENAAVNGQVIVTWPWVDSTSFDAKAFKDTSPEHKALYDAFLKTKKTRRFKVTGVVGVD